METKDMIPTIPDDVFLFRRGKTTLDGFGRVMGSWEEDSDATRRAGIEMVEMIGKLKFVSVCSVQSDTPKVRALIKDRIRHAVWKNFYSGLYYAISKLAILIIEGNREEAEALILKIRDELLKAGE